MVKNVKGGSSHKSQARKFAGDANSSKQHSKLRVIEEDGEIYAQITKNYGNGMCDALCIDNVTRLCIIRGKFRGRGKRDNTIRVGSWILAGKRDWESEKSGEKQKCLCPGDEQRGIKVGLARKILQDRRITPGAALIG